MNNERISSSRLFISFTGTLVCCARYATSNNQYLASRAPKLPPDTNSWMVTLSWTILHTVFAASRAEEGTCTPPQ
ncbi:hypothetical protein D3C76_1396290 [compost metagenome]